MLQRLFGKNLWVRPMVMMLALGSLTVQSVQAQSSSTWFGFAEADNSRQSGRPAGGSGGVDIVVFDIVDSVSKATGRPAGGGGDIVIFDIVDGVAACRVMLLRESTIPGVYEVLVDMGDSIEFGLMWEEPRLEAYVIVLQYKF